MTILRSGSSKNYSTNWNAAFGESKSSTKSKSNTEKTPKAKKKAATGKKKAAKK